MVDKKKIPSHIAIIMDGNGRWAKKRGLARTEGHRRGMRVLRQIIQDACDLNIKYLTLYAFSSENWKRKKDEVDFLMKACEAMLAQELSGMIKNNICFKHIGRLTDLPKSLQDAITHATSLTRHNNKLFLQLAFNYGSRLEIIDAVKEIAQRVKDGAIPIEDIDESIFSAALYTRNIPDPDLLVRTSGEMRLSNFLLWQLSYAEFYVTKKYWPDFNKKELVRAIIDYQKRQRRFGGADA